MTDKKEHFDYKSALSYTRRRNMSFSQWIEDFVQYPGKHLSTSSTLIADAIKHFGYKIVIRSGEPVISYNIFKDIFSNGVNAVYGQENSIKRMVDVIESISKETGPNRGLVLVGPPASGKTNIVDLIGLALEEYTKESNMKLYSFYYQFNDIDDPKQSVEIRSTFFHNPILFFTTMLHNDEGVLRPRQELFEYINRDRAMHEKITIPTYYQNASLDKRNLDILENLLNHERNKGKTLFDVIEEYVRVEEIEFTNAQGKGISNIDTLSKLDVRVQPVNMGSEASEILSQHLPPNLLYGYDGALVSANRGLLHIHDAFTGTQDAEYQPLLMLLGSGKVSLEATQASIDTVVVVTTNIEDMDEINNQLKTSKLLDRIEKVPVNYLLDAYSEVDILKRDMAIIKDRYDVDPNLFKIASYFSVMTRLLPPVATVFPSTWDDTQVNLYHNISPEQKLFLYAARPSNPLKMIRSLPYWHPFRNQASKLGIDLYDEEEFQKYLDEQSDAPTLETCGVFNAEQVALIDAEFMRELRKERTQDEGKTGISIRQLQNIMRNTISNSDGRAVLVNNFIEQIEMVVSEGEELHHWLGVADIYDRGKKCKGRAIAGVTFAEGEGDYGDFRGLVKVVRAIYNMIIKREIITSTVDRDPVQIELDLRRYIQSALLFQAVENKAFAHIMVPKFSYIDPVSGNKISKPDENFLLAIEDILCSDKNFIKFRKATAQKYFDMVDSGKLSVDDSKSIINSKNDQLLQCFDKEHNKLISHRKTEEGIDAAVIEKAFFKKHFDPPEYLKINPDIRKFVETVIHNMSQRYHYSNKIATETIVFALRENIVDFKSILN